MSGGYIGESKLDARTQAALGLAGRGFFTWRLRGMREIAAAPTIEQAWQGPTAFPTLPLIGAALTAVSDAATDNPAGTGARTIAVVYLNALFEIRLGVADLAGLVVVPLLEFDQLTQTSGAAVLDALRVLAVNVTDVGGTENNDGKIRRPS